MYIITVTFTIQPQHLDDFLPAMRAQAKNSLELEEGCHTFYVGIAEDDTNQVFLYEEYTDRAAFEVHLASAHFAEFNAIVEPWVAAKEVRGWHRQ